MSMGEHSRQLAGKSHKDSRCRQYLAKVNTLMTFKSKAESRLKDANKTKSAFEEFLDQEWRPHHKKFQDFIDEEWPPTKRRFNDLLQRDLDGRTNHAPDIIESGPEMPGPEDDDMPAAKHTGKKSRSDRSDPPMTPHKKRPSSGSATCRWWVELQPLPLDKAPTSWHAELLNALLAEWTDSQMTRLQQWIAIHATEEMRVTLDALSTVNTTR